MIFLTKTPKFFFLKGDSLNIALEKKIHDRLDNYIIYYDSKETPYLQEIETRKIIEDVGESLEDF